MWMRHFISVGWLLLCLTVIKATETETTFIASDTLYTKEYLEAFPFFNSIVQISHFDGDINNARNLPQWSTDLRMQIRNEKYNQLTQSEKSHLRGRIGYEYVLYDSRHENIAFNAKPTVPVINLCKLGSNHLDMSRFETSFETLLEFKSFSFEDSSDLNIQSTKPLPDTGVWINVIYICFDNDVIDPSSDMIISATHFTENPLGFLGGQYLIALPVLSILSLIYFCVALIWLYLLLKWNDNALPHHWFIFGAIIIALLETLSHLYHYKSINYSGEQSSSMIWLNTILTIMLATYSRILVALISTGIGIAIPFQEVSSKKIQFIALFSICYVCVYGTIKFKQLHATIKELSFHSSQQWIICLSLLDGIIAWFILENLMIVFDHLKLTSQWYKFHLYRNLTAAMMSVLVLSVIGLSGHILFSKYQYYTNPVYWPLYWILNDGIWRIFYLIVGGSIIAIWRPHKHSKRYAYSLQITKCPSKHTPAWNMNNTVLNSTNSPLKCLSDNSITGYTSLASE